MEFRYLAGLLVALVLFVSSEAAAVTKVRDGFATSLVTDGTSLIPRNPVTRAHEGDDVYYWIQWKEPVPRSTLRCVIKGPDTNVDETENFAEAEGDGYSVCGVETESSGGGTYTFTQYLDGQMVGEKSITVEKERFFNLSLRKKWKWMMTGLGLIIVIGYWIRRKMTGDKRSIKEILGGEAQGTPAAREALTIGSRIDGGAPAMAMTPPPPPPPKVDEASELRTLGQQFQTLMAQTDKAKGLELGRNYLGLLLKARNDPEAIKVFKECLAADGAFRPAHASEVLQIAKAARGAGDSKAAAAALRGFDKIYPGAALVPDMYMLSAKLMAEDLGNAEMARKILQHVLVKYPGHYLAQEAKRYLDSMPKVG